MLTGMRIYYAFEFALSILSASASTIDPRIRRIPYLPYSIPLSTIFDKQTHFAANICQWWSHTYFSSVTQLCPTLCDPMDCSTPGFPVHHRLLDLLKLNSIKSVMPTYHFILCHPLLLLPSVLPSIRVFSNESVLHIRWPKYWRFSFSISPSNEYSGLISFRIEVLISLQSKGLSRVFSNITIQKSVNSLVLMVQLSHPCMTTRKTIALTIWTFVGKVMSLLFNTLSGLS